MKKRENSLFFILNMEFASICLCANGNDSGNMDAYASGEALYPNRGDETLALDVWELTFGRGKNNSSFVFRLRM